jgi:hypothetical protein
MHNARLCFRNRRTAKSQLWLYEYMFQMWRINPYALCIRTFNRI